MKALPLHGRHLEALGPVPARPFLVRIVTQREADVATHPRSDHDALLVAGEPNELPPGFGTYLFRTRPTAPLPAGASGFLLASALDYLGAGDVLRIDPNRGYVQVLYRRTSPSNSLLVTERCDNYCLMCSQPPKEKNDDWIVDEIFRFLPLIDKGTSEIGITGGEPALIGRRLIDLVARLKSTLPQTAVHVLSNGRAFADKSYTQSLAGVLHPDLMIGIPVYSDVAEEHDFVVQARGAFSETIRGILALKDAGVRVELRMVIHAETYRSLPAFGDFVARNLAFVDHVALMGLELVGFAKANVDRLWVDPLDYQELLAKTAHGLDRAGMRVSIYNHQLCTLPETLWPFARQSISDWKNDFIEPCEGCGVRSSCGGFFVSSNLRRSRGIAPIAANTVARSAL